MRKALFIIMLMAFVCSSTKAQKLILLPEAGVQTHRSQISNSNLFHRYSTYSNLSPSIGTRLMYFSKQGHGPYVGYRLGDMNISSSDSTGFRTTGVTLHRFELGYQWLSKPIYFKQIWNNNISRAEFENRPRKGWAVQLMPSAGLVYTRGLPGSSSYSFGSTTVKEFANRSNFGLATGLGMLFSKDGKPVFNLSVGYTKNFGDLYSSNFYKPGSSSYQTTKGSGWNISLGVPISLFGKKK